MLINAHVLKVTFKYFNEEMLSQNDNVMSLLRGCIFYLPDWLQCPVFLWLMPLSSQTRPLVCVRLLCCHVHQRCQRSQTGWGEDGRSRPRCVVGPGAVCIHRYREILTLVNRDIDLCICRHPSSSNPVYSYIQTVLFYIPGRLELREDTIESLLSASCLLQLSSVVQACCSFLMKQLHPSNCLGIRSYADAQGCRDLQRAAHAYTMVGKPPVTLQPLLWEEHEAISDSSVAYCVWEMLC